MSEQFEGLDDSERDELLHKATVIESFLKTANTSSKFRKNLNEEIMAVKKITDEFLARPGPNIINSFGGQDHEKRRLMRSLISVLGREKPDYRVILEKAHLLLQHSRSDDPEISEPPMWLPDDQDETVGRRTEDVDMNNYPEFFEIAKIEDLESNRKRQCQGDDFDDESDDEPEERWQDLPMGVDDILLLVANKTEQLKLEAEEGDSKGKKGNQKGLRRVEGKGKGKGKTLFPISAEMIVDGKEGDDLGTVDDEDREQEKSRIEEDKDDSFEDYLQYLDANKDCWEEMADEGTTTF